MHRAIWLALALVAPLTAGCLGSVTPASIPEQALSQNGWSETRDERQSIAGGLAEVVTREYTKGGTQALAGAIVATLNDIPILDERERLIPIALEQVEEQQGITLRETGTRTLQLTNLGVTVTGTEYDIEGAALPAKGVLFTPSCGDFVVVVAYGTLPQQGGVLGGSAPDRYGEARDVARTVTCG